MAKKKKDGSKFLTVLLVVLVILLIGALVFTLYTFGIEIPFLNRNENALEKALNENNYQAAYTVYDASENKDAETLILYQHLDEYFLLCESDEYSSDVWTKYRGLEVFKAEIEDTVLKKMEDVVLRYYNGTIEEDAAKTYLSRLSKFSFANEKYDECIKDVGLKDFSDKAYLEGVELYNQGKIEDAVKAFIKVSDKDGQRYPLALDAIKRCKSEWGAEKLQEAQMMIDAYNKEGARDLIEKLIEVFGEYEEAENLLSTLEPAVEG